MGAYGALLRQSALNMSLGMLHYLQRAFLWPRWDMTEATGSSWIKQRGLKAQGGGGWGCRVMERPEDMVEHWGSRLPCTCSRCLRVGGGWSRGEAGRKEGTERRKIILLMEKQHVKPTEKKETQLMELEECCSYINIIAKRGTVVLKSRKTIIPHIHLWNTEVRMMSCSQWTVKRLCYVSAAGKIGWAVSSFWFPSAYLNGWHNLI